MIQKAPNIIILLADDLGKYEVSAYGEDHVLTPNIDKIGEEGVIFEEGYVTAPTCAPSRSGIMTGRVQNRYGFETQVMEFYPTNIVEYLSGKYFVNTGDFVVEAKPQFPAEWQVHKQGVPPTEITLAERLKSHGIQHRNCWKMAFGNFKTQFAAQSWFRLSVWILWCFFVIHPRTELESYNQLRTSVV